MLAQEVVDEVIIVATGREAEIQDVPIAVTALNAETLLKAGVGDLFDVEQLAPSFRLWAGQSTVTGAIALIRGIGTGADNPGFESAVGIFVDGVYRARPGAALSMLPQLERIEVLRGPQGTLFGRNTSAGAVNIFTAAPDFTADAWMSAAAGDLSLVELNGGVNLPVVGDRLALRVDGAYQTKNGYITDVISGSEINDRDRWLLRGQALWVIGSDATLRLTADAAQTDEACCAAAPLIYGPSQYVIEAIAGAAATLPGAVATGNPLERRNSRFKERELTVTPGRNYAEAVDDWGLSGQLDWGLGFAELTSITAYRDWSASRNQDIDFNLFDLAYRDGQKIGFETFTQEVRLHGQAGRLDWLAGLFYGDERLDTTDRVRLGADADAYLNGAVQFLTAAALGAPFELFDTTAGDDDHPFPDVGIPPFPPPAIPGSGGLDPVPSLFYAAGIDSANPFPTSTFENLYLTLTSPAGSGQQADRWTVRTRSFALFTHNEYALTDQLILTAGIRYNHDSKDLRASLAATSPACLNLQGIEAATGGLVSAVIPTAAGGALNLACNPAINPIANGDWTGYRDEDAWSGTASLAYHFNDDLMVYGGYSRGYKSGGYNVDRSGFALNPALLSAAALNTSQLGFEPEFTDAYELGLKSALFSGTATLNVDLFHETISDFQLNAFNGSSFTTQNVPRSISRGVEIDVLSRPLDRLTLQGGLIYNDAFYDSMVVFNAGDPARNTVFKGDPLDHAPKWSLTGAATYEWPLSGSLLATLYLDGRWNSAYRNQTLSRDPLGRTDQDAYAIFNGRVAIGDPDGSWSVEAWARNLAGAFYTVGAFEAPLQPGTYIIYPGEPRSWGLTLRARY